LEGFTLPEFHSSLDTPNSQSQSNDRQPINLLSPLARAALVFLSIGSVSALQYLIGIVPGVFPGINLITVILLAVLSGALLSLVWITIIPWFDVLNLKSYGKFAWLGFIFQALLFASMIMFAGQYLDYFTRTLLPDFISVMQFSGGNLTFYSSGQLAGDASQLIVIGAVCVVIAFFITILGRKWLQRSLIAAAILNFLALAIPIAESILFAPESYHVRFNEMIGSGSYSDHINQALTAGMVFQSPSAAVALVIGFAGSVFLFFGYQIFSVFNQDFQPVHSKDTHRWRLPGLAFGFNAVLMLAEIFLIVRMIPGQFLAAESYIQVFTIPVNSFVLPWLPYYLAIIQSNPIWVVLSTLTWIFGFLVILIPLLLMTGKLVLHWASAGLAPEWMAKTNPDSQSPVIAQMLVTFAFLAVLVWSALDPLHMSWFVFPFSIVVTMTGIILFELVRILADKQYRELLEKRAGGKGRFILNLAVSLLTMVFLIGYIVFEQKQLMFLSGPVGNTWLFLAIITAAALVWFVVYRLFGDRMFAVPAQKNLISKD
jgi:amino acid transporter